MPACDYIRHAQCQQARHSLAISQYFIASSASFETIRQSEHDILENRAIATLIS